MKNEVRFSSRHTSKFQNHSSMASMCTYLRVFMSIIYYNMSSVVWFFHDSFQTQASADLKNVLQVPQKKCNIYLAKPADFREI